MKKSFTLCLTVILELSFLQFAQAQGNPEAAKLAREGARAAKAEDWNKAIELFRKATDLDHKFAPNLAAAYQQRGFTFTNDQRFQEALVDLNEALKINPRDPRIYEQLAAVEMRINDYDRALADYSEAIKLNPDEIRYYLYRGYIYETRGDVNNAMADTDKALKLQPKNPEALARKARLQKIQQSQAPLQPPPPQNPPPAVPARTP